MIISGKDKGKQGTVARVLPRRRHVIVEGLNMRKRHQRPRRAGQKGQTVEFAAPLHISNVQLADPKTEKPTRVGYKTTEGKKIRIAKKSGTKI